MGKYFNIYELKLTHRELLVYKYLEDRADRGGRCFPSSKRIATDLNLSRRTVFRAIEDLKRRELITTKQRYRENGGRSSLEFFLPHAVRKDSS